ncbi:ASKHA domain-containing protein [Lachnospiraceae bacterium OttesenSCG-928-D06]|nr:ASKHA domain-containing protein [Lachnospiraceae bacterium OttesenSCG-928-D06]
MNIRIKKSNEPDVVIKGHTGQTLMEILRENGVYHSAICGGMGTCGKCGVRVLSGEVKITKEDEAFFNEGELKKGYRLSCHGKADGDCTIMLLSDTEENFHILTDYNEKPGFQNISPQNIDGKNGEWGIAADIGTTTIAMQLISLETGEVGNTYRTINGQRAYGGDVISRIEASNQGKGQELQNSIRRDLLKGLEELTEKGNINIKKMVIAANTTMVHLLLGYSCETLGRYPFTPVTVETIQISSEELLGTSAYSFEVILYPGISTFVGGDIAAGLYALSFDKAEKVSVLIDFGTNGEMAVGNKDKILVTSTAAGPAFEGGNITCGTGSIPGAICSMELVGENIQFETIDHKPVRGICGTGVIDITCALLKAGLVDETGLLEEEYFEKGFLITEDENGKPVIFYQKDIREIQLAKSAVRAGLETLMLKYQLSFDEIHKVYLAGGFGHGINVENAIRIGLLKEECRGKIEVVGNTSLQGARLYMLEPEGEERIEKIRARAEEISLAKDKDFNRLYMEHMYFESDEEEVHGI